MGLRVLERTSSAIFHCSCTVLFGSYAVLFGSYVGIFDSRAIFVVRLGSWFVDRLFRVQHHACSLLEHSRLLI